MTQADWFVGRTIMASGFEKGDYEACFKVIKPDQPVPDAIQGKTMFKITPFPLGMTAATLKEWMKDIKWQGFPFKPIGPQAWLFASDCNPPSSCVTYNGTRMLVRSLPKKTMKRTSPVVAGPRLPQRESKPTGTVDPGMPKTDPWAQYKPTQGAIQAANAPRTPTGTVQHKLQVQDDKIANIAEELSKLKSSHHISNLDRKCSRGLINCKPAWTPQRHHSHSSWVRLRLTLKHPSNQHCKRSSTALQMDSKILQPCFSRRRKQKAFDDHISRWKIACM